jgi:hypothetical protein
MDGYYFTVALKTSVDPHSGISSSEGKNAVLWYKSFKAGGTNDGETPDDTVTMAPIYPQGDLPADNDPATIDDGFRNGCKQFSFFRCDKIRSI